jgi:hypothetical protein
MNRKSHYIERAFHSSMAVAFGLPMALAFGMVASAKFRAVPDWAVYGAFLVGTLWFGYWLWYGFRCIDKAFERSEVPQPAESK